MSLDEKFIPVRTTFYDLISNFLKKIAELFGYPVNSGMPTLMDFPSKVDARSEFLENLPRHSTFWPPIQRPETWFEMIFGPYPKVDTVPRFIYESKEEGFYNFYIENYKNIYFLPDWVSELIQVKLHICFDITLLETIREVLFVGLLVYSQIVMLRIVLAWYISINPYTVPWCYIAAVVDWTEDVLQGVVPSILGVNLTATIFLGILGVIADGLNHLIFTMPFLPSEGVETKLLINEQMKDVLVFHYLPILWYRYPIPNEIREFWYKERTDILEYMQKAYKNLDVQFLPDKIVEEFNQQKLIVNLTEFSDSLLSQSNNLTDYFSTEVLSQNTLFPIHLVSTILTFINQHLHNFSVIDIRF
jgi:uncharacterized protein YggT (Ycf19 family)